MYLMETQTPEQVPSRKPRIILVLAGIVFAVLFVALNVWVYRFATKEKAPLIPSSAGLKKPSVPASVPSRAQTPSADSNSVGSQPTPLPPPPIPPDPVPPVSVGPGSP